MVRSIGQTPRSPSGASGSPPAQSTRSGVWSNPPLESSGSTARPDHEDGDRVESDAVTAERGAPADAGAEGGHHVLERGNGLLSEQDDDVVGGELGRSAWPARSTRGSPRRSRPITHRAPPDRAAVSTRNSSASFTVGNTCDARTFATAAAVSGCGSSRTCWARSCCGPRSGPARDCGGGWSVEGRPRERDNRPGAADGRGRGPPPGVCDAGTRRRPRRRGGAVAGYRRPQLAAGAAAMPDCCSS